MEDYFENALFGTPFTSAVIVAAGSSTRMGGEDKQFIRLCGKPILAHSMTAFQNCPVIEEIVVVTKADSVEAVRAMAAEYGIDKLTAVTEGGASRAESVRNGVAAVSCGAEFVAIHDGARPLVTPEDIARCATDAFRCGGAVLAVPVTDTVKYGRKNGFVEYTPAREKRAAMERAFRELSDWTDDSRVFENDGRRVFLTPGNRKNIKITSPEDVLIAEAFLKGGEKE